jgi:hypothetical protein
MASGPAIQSKFKALCAPPWAYFHLGTVQVILRIPHASLAAFHDMINRHPTLRAETSGHEIYREPPERDVTCKDDAHVSIIGQLPGAAAVACSDLLGAASSLRQDRK